MALVTKTLKLTNAFQSIFGAVVPASTEYVVIGLRAANIDGTAATSFEVKAVPASGDEAHLAAPKTPLAIGAAEPLVVGDYFKLGASDDIQAKCEDGSDMVSVIVTYRSSSVA